MKMFKVLVSGGAGFIMSTFVDICINQGWEVINIDGMLEGSHLNNLNKDAVNIFDMVERVNYERLFNLHGKPDYIISGAALSNVDTSIKQPRTFLSNIESTVILCEIARNYDIPLIIVSTDEVTGSYPHNPINGAVPAFDENSKLNPSSAYAASKASAELMAMSYYKTFGIDLKITRGSNTYGIRQQDKLIPTIFKKIYSGKKVPIFKSLALRDWLHVADHASAFLHVMKYGKAGEIYNITGGNRHSPREIAEMVGADIEEVPDRLAYDLDYYCNGSKLRDIGWYPLHHDVKDDMINELQPWYFKAYSTGYFS